MSYVAGKDKNEILEKLIWWWPVWSLVHEQQKMWIVVRCTEDLQNSIKESADSSWSLANKVFYLNIILTLATLVWAWATVMIALK